ncbi:MAG: DUF3108 domain-containing protein [bacterium]
MRISAMFLAGGAVATVLLSGCGSSEDTPITKVFVHAPWTANESNEYNLVIEDNKVYGTCTLETKLADGGANTRMNRLCGDGENRDDGTVLVDPQTLVPIEASRTALRKDSRVSFTTTYAPPTVTFVSDENGKQRQTQRDLPVPNSTSPDPGYYDDESLLWLVRGIDLREGYKGSYQNVSAGTGQTFRVDLKVEGQERVSVPAGEFTAWKIRISTENVTQFAWVDVQSPNRLVQARINGVQDVTYKLVRSQ